MIFGTIADDANKSGQALTLFHKKISDIVKETKTDGFKNGLSGVFKSNISQTDIAAIQKYNDLISSGVDANKAYRKSMKNASDSTKKMALASGNAAIKINTMTVAQKAATVASKALKIGLNALFNIGVAAAINVIVSGITKLVNKQKESSEAAAQLKQEQEERRQAAIESSKATEEEIKSIHDLTDRYVKLYSTTNDITTIKGELSSIQDEIIDKYGREADGIDLVNGKLSENLAKMREIEQEENKQWLRENRQGINEAKDYFKNLDDVMLKFDVEAKDFQQDYGGYYSWVEDNGQGNYKMAKREAQFYFDFLKKALEESGMSDYINFVEGESGDWSRGNTPATFKYRYALEFADGITDEQKERVYLALQDAYDKMLNSNIAVGRYFDITGQKAERLNERTDEIVDHYTTLSDAESRLSENSAWDDLSQDTQNHFADLINQLASLSQEINNPENTPAVIYSKQLELDELKSKLLSLTAEFPILSEEAERAFSNMGLNIDGTIASTDNLRESFFETLDEIQKGTLTNVDTIEKAMKTLADGGELEHMDAWDIWQLDKDELIEPYADANYKLKIDYEDLVKLKDHLIQQEQEQLRLSVQTSEQARRNAQTELAEIDAEICYEAKGNTKPSEKLTEKQAELRKQIKDWGKDIQRNELLIKVLNSRLGDTITAEEKIKKIQKDINKLQEQADNYEKAFTQKVDNVIDNLESEKEILDEELDSLNDQLDALEKQKDELDEIIDNYKQAADIVSDAADKEKELLEEQREAQEKAYNERIDALKEAHDKQEEENELTEKQIALQEKLQALDKARQNKVMTYSSERGWHYDVDKENLLAAQKDVDDAQKNIDDYLSEKAYEAEIKAIEDERDSVLESFDLQIEAYENYVKEWKEILEEQTDAENERLAQEILGSDWREKIKNKDAQILNNYKSEFRNYNSQLSSLVNGEIANLKQSIEAKNEEIKAKQELIDQWKKYKSEVQNAISSIKNANEDYMQYLGNIALDENSSFEEREANLANFTQNYKSYLDEIIAKNYELEEANNSIAESMAALSEIQLSVDSAAGAASKSITNALEAIAKMTIFDKFEGLGSFFYDALGSLPGFSNGGTADYTGLAMLHGTKSNPELILNNADAAKLYNVIHDSSFTDMMTEKLYGNLIKSFPVNNNNSASNTNNSFNISHMEVKANDPVQFHEQFQKELKQHYGFALNESLVR